MRKGCHERCDLFALQDGKGYKLEMIKPVDLRRERMQILRCFNANENYSLILRNIRITWQVAA